MPVGAQPSGRDAGATVFVSWAPVTLPGGAAVAGYVVARINAATGAEATVNPGCAGVVATSSCTETGVAPGSWVYTETPVLANWTGSASPASGTIVVPLT